MSPELFDDTAALTRVPISTRLASSCASCCAISARIRQPVQGTETSLILKALTNSRPRRLRNCCARRAGAKPSASPSQRQPRQACPQAGGDLDAITLKAVAPTARTATPAPSNLPTISSTTCSAGRCAPWATAAAIASAASSRATHGRRGHVSHHSGPCHRNDLGADRHEPGANPAADRRGAVAGTGKNGRVPAIDAGRPGSTPARRRVRRTACATSTRSLSITWPSDETVEAGIEAFEIAVGGSIRPTWRRT